MYITLAELIAILTLTVLIVELIIKIDDHHNKKN